MFIKKSNLLTFLDRYTAIKDKKLKQLFIELLLDGINDGVDEEKALDNAIRSINEHIYGVCMGR